MPEPNYRHLENKSRIQHYVTVLVERLAGKQPCEIAKSLHMTEESVRRDLEYVGRTWTQIFSPDGSLRGRSISTVTDPGSYWKIETECDKCGVCIKAGEDRLIVAVLELVTEMDFGEGSYKHNGVAVESGSYQVSVVDRTTSLHYCEKCAEHPREFKIANPLWLAGSTAPAQTTVNELPNNQGNGTNVGALPQGGENPRSGEDAQKEFLSGFLQQANSSGMRPEMRSAAKMWVEGASQTEIARKLGKDQSTICRMLSGARSMAYACR